MKGIIPMAAKSKSSRFSSFLGIVTILVILVSVFVFSGTFSTIMTTITKSKASQANAKLTESFGDNFKDGVIDEKKWVVATFGGATVRETAADNLRMDIPEGNEGGKVKRASLTLKELMETKGDFRIISVLYRPLVTGEGTGVSGMRFQSKGGNDDESASVHWTVNGTNSKVTFVVRAPDGTRLEAKSEELKSNVAVFMLERVNKRYRASFKPGRDASADVPWTPLGAEQNAALGDDGYVALFTTNGGVGGKFPKVVGRFDSVGIAWEGEAADHVGFNDAFADGAVGKNWNVHKAEGSQVYENKNDNLIVSVPAGAYNNKARYTWLRRKTPVIPVGKDFALAAQMFKPTVVGEGNGYAGLGFASAGAVDDEAAALRWVVGKNANRIVFVVRNPDGTLAERAAVNVPDTAKSLTLRLVRNGNSYRGWYRTGDGDTDWILVGKEDNANFGANGVMSLVVSNAGVPGKFPRVVGRFDRASGSVAK